MKARIRSLLGAVGLCMLAAPGSPPGQAKDYSFADMRKLRIELPVERMLRTPALTSTGALSGTFAAGAPGGWLSGGGGSTSSGTPSVSSTLSASRGASASSGTPSPGSVLVAGSALAGGGAPAAAETQPPTRSAAIKPAKVAPGLVSWQPDLDSACHAAKVSGKPVLLFQMMGKLDEEFC